jgi:hypothetical protein
VDRLGDNLLGNDERVTERSVRRGVEMTIEILERFAATRPIMENC